MKVTMKLLALFLGELMLENIANAESPREQLKKMVGQLKKSPTDNISRAKLIKLAQTLKPAPAVLDEASWGKACASACRPACVDVTGKRTGSMKS